MTRYSIYFPALLAFSFLLADASASQAGLFGRWRGNYGYQSYYQPSPQPATPSAAQPAPATSQTAPAPASPMVYSVAMPVTSPSPAIPAPVAQPGGAYAPPTGAATGGWSVAPRSSWDFGSFPPYSR